MTENILILNLQLSEFDKYIHHAMIPQSRFKTFLLASKKSPQATPQTTADLLPVIDWLCLFQNFR